MLTASSAALTWGACASASLNTATLLIPSSLQARMILTAISPRLAINTFVITGGKCKEVGWRQHHREGRRAVNLESNLLAMRHASPYISRRPASAANS